MPEVVTVPYLYIFCQHSGDEQAKDGLNISDQVIGNVRFPHLLYCFVR